jgi:hypothetical protein
VICDSPVFEGQSNEHYGGHLVAESIAPRNLALIAAAPEILEAAVALIACIDLPGNRDEYHAALARLRSAAAQAQMPTS